MPPREHKKVDYAELEAFSDNSSETKKKNSHGTYISWSRQEDSLLLEQVQKYLNIQKLNNNENLIKSDKKNNTENISENNLAPNINNINWLKISENFNNKNAKQCQMRWQNILDPNRIKGPWTKDEDTKLIELVKKYGPEKWSNISNFLPGRLGKQCRERWYNHLNPEVRKTGWSKEEEWVLFLLHRKFGNSWSIFSEYMPGRTDNTIKNHWNSIMKKNIVGINNQYQDMIKGKNKNEIDKIEENILINCSQKIKKDYNEYFQEKLKIFPNMKISGCKPISNLFSSDVNSEKKNIAKLKQRKSRKKRVSLSLDDKIANSNKKIINNKLSEVKTPVKEKKKIFTNVKEKKSKSKKLSEIKSIKKKSSKKSVNKISENEEDNNVMKSKQKTQQKEKNVIVKDVENKSSKKKKNKKSKNKKEKKEEQSSIISLNEEIDDLNKTNKKRNKRMPKSKSKNKKPGNRKKNKFNIYKISPNNCKSKNKNNQTINNNISHQINNINNINNTEININNFGSPNASGNINPFGNFGNFSNFGVFNPEFSGFPPYINPNYPFEKLPFYSEEERDYPKMNMNKILISNSKDIKNNNKDTQTQKIENRPFFHTELKQGSESSDKNDSFAKNTPDFPRVGPFVQSSDKRFVFTNPHNLQNRNIFGPMKFGGVERKNNINKSTDSNSIMSYSINQSMLSANSAFKKSSSGSGSGSGNSLGHNLMFNNNADLNKEYFSSISLDEKNNK